MAVRNPLRGPGSNQWADKPPLPPSPVEAGRAAALRRQSIFDAPDPLAVDAPATVEVVPDAERGTLSRRMPAHRVALTARHEAERCRQLAEPLKALFPLEAADELTRAEHHQAFSDGPASAAQRWGSDLLDGQVTRLGTLTGPERAVWGTTAGEMTVFDVDGAAVPVPVPGREVTVA